MYVQCDANVGPKPEQRDRAINVDQQVMFADVQRLDLLLIKISGAETLFVIVHKLAGGILYCMRVGNL